MPRHKEFDQEQAVEQALDLFWTKGYEQTSVQDLCRHLGINRGSLYDTFGSKLSLFLTCMDRYSANTDENLYAVLLKQDGAPKEQLRRFFDKVIASSMEDAEMKRGCFLTNTAVEVAAFEPAVAARVDARMRHAEQVFYDFLARAQESGELRGDPDLRAMARFLLNTKQGLHLLAKTEVDRMVLEDACKIAISLLM